MVRLDMFCTSFMDSDPVIGSEVTVRLLILPRFFHRPNLPDEPDLDDLDDKEQWLIPDMDLGETLTATRITDALGRATFEFDADDAWQEVAARQNSHGRPRDVVGYVTSRADLRSIALFGGHPVLMARTPAAAVRAVVIIDPAKIVIGYTEATTARILFQLHAAPRAGFRFVGVLRDGAGTVDRRTVAIANDATHTGTLTFQALRPASTYTVAFLAENLANGAETVLARARLRTFSVQPVRWTLDFTSCHLPTNAQSLRPWIRAAARDPADLLLLLGDQIYGDAVSETTPNSLPWLDRYAMRYDQLWAYQPMRQVLRQTPTVTIFDDHEVVDDWGVASSAEIGVDRLTGAIGAYRRFQDALNPQGRLEGVFDYNFRSGAVAGYVLDERSQRGRDGRHNVLGAAQFERLRQWAASPNTRAADVIIIASSVPFAYLPTERLEDVVGGVVTGTGAVVGAVTGGLLFGPAGAIVGGFIGAAGSALAYDEVTEDIREPDLQDQWVHDRNQTELTAVLDILFDLANDITDGVPGPQQRAVFVLSGDVHVGGVHLLHSNRRGQGHDHSRNRLIYQLTSSPVTTNNPDNAILNDLLDGVGSQVDLADAEFLKDNPDRQTANPFDVSRFVLDSNGDEHYAAENLGVLRDRNLGRLVIERAGGRRYRFMATVDGSNESLVSIFELDLGAQRVRPRDLIGQRLVTTGRPVLLRVHDIGSSFGPSNDRIDGEVVVQLDSEPGRAFGFQLRVGLEEPARRGMLDLLRDAFNTGDRVAIEYDRTGPKNGSIVRVIAPVL
jgi:hypothetical protein